MFSIARTDTVASIMAVIPKPAVISGLYIIGSVASDATTSASVNVGTSSTATELLNAFDVKTAATATGYQPAAAKAVGSVMCTPLTVDTPLYAKYVSSGAESTGGPWIVKVEYFITGPGETL